MNEKFSQIPANYDVSLEGTTEGERQELLKQAGEAYKKLKAEFHSAKNYDQPVSREKHERAKAFNATASIIGMDLNISHTELMEAGLWDPYLEIKRQQKMAANDNSVRAEKAS